MNYLNRLPWLESDLNNFSNEKLIKETFFIDKFRHLLEISQEFENDLAEFFDTEKELNKKWKLEKGGESEQEI